MQFFKKSKIMSKKKKTTGNEKIFFINYKSMRHMQIWGSTDIKTRLSYLKETYIHAVIYFITKLTLKAGRKV